MIHTPTLRNAASRRSQAGLSLMGLIFWSIVVSFIAVIALRVLPTINEYQTIQRVVERIAKDGGSTVTELRTAFERGKQIEYSISSLSGNDLDITKRDDRVVISYAYDKEIELFGPVYLLIKYSGTSAK
jgi:Domain of unknown function (DUF4845)